MASEMTQAAELASAQPKTAARPRPKAAEGQGALVARDMVKTFRKRPVVRGVSISLKRGEVVGLLGPNGAGKTTCFYMITGLIPVDSGSISIDGHDVTRLPMYQRARLGLGYLPQEASIFRGLTVEQNLRAVVELVERDKARQQILIDDLLEEFGIAHIRTSSALALSGGERRRVEIARALATGPAFMLLDEPFAGIDPLAIADIRSLVLHLKDRGLGVLITDHNVRETLDIIDRAYIIHEGEVLIEGKPSDIVGDKDVRRVYLGDRFQM
jgi:lipopolysaccharide export system ATP-binding protein